MSLGGGRATSYHFAQDNRVKLMQHVPLLGG
ncbi:hypothetical protein clem_00500 [Legionella clemsonensis]|uniref:Uncharacterized protein n=1 Tax=Legionella clemsonensis TaxID=1867846 RepID=A0A222NYK7_9GAMM|nr:hypothetical protein clem_00500 [Legionella clemsonensis]